MTKALWIWIDFFFVVLSCSTNQKLVPCHNRHTRKIEILSINSRVQRRCVRQHCKWFTRSYTTENVYKCWPHARCLSVCLRRQVPHTTYIHTYICNAHTVASGLHTRVCARGYCIGIWVAMATWESKQNSMTASQSRTSTWTTTHRLIEWHKLSHVARCVMDLFIMVLAATNGRPRGQFLLIDCGQMECMIGCDATHSTRLRSIFVLTSIQKNVEIAIYHFGSELFCSKKNHFVWCRICRCRIPECDLTGDAAVYDESWLDRAIPSEKNRLKKCLRYNTNITIAARLATSGGVDDERCPAIIFDRNDVIRCDDFVFKTNERRLIQEVVAASRLEFWIL